MRFSWSGYEVSSLLPAGWQEQSVKVAKEHAVFVEIPRASLGPRRNSEGVRLHRGRVRGEVVIEKLPWLFEAYKSTFLELAREYSSEEIVCATDARYGVALNVTTGRDMGFECHVDSNPLEGLLFCTTHARGSGGELVVANSEDARGVSDVDADPATIYPSVGQLIFFDGRLHAHYVRELCNQDTVRVVAAMNYYTSSCPESVKTTEYDSYSSYLRIV
jgi:hypothetical protein